MGCPRFTAVVSLLLLSLISHACAEDDADVFLSSWVVHLKEDMSPERVKRMAHDLGFTYHSQVFQNDKRIHVLEHPRVTKRSTKHASDHHQLLMDHYLVAEAEQEKLLRRVKRAHIPEPKIRLSDPLWNQMWYLNRGIGSKDNWDMNIISAWNKGYSGDGSVVTILDDGIERDHPDLVENYSPEASYDINGEDKDPMPRYDYSNENRHGTRCAGEVAAAANNSICGVGVAFNAKIGGIRMLDGDVTDRVESRSLSHNQDHIDIYSASWGPDDNGRVVDGPGKLAKKSFLEGVTTGRRGKGNIFVWASGNGGNRGDSCACDGYSNSVYTLSVSSAAEGNGAPWYLEQCASTMATTYSSGANYQEKQIVSTDLRKQCTSRHTGTSASAPLAAGLVAVMLEANPQLTWRDVQYCVMLSSNPEPLQSHGEFIKNGMNRLVSHKFGYGLMDAGKMVDVAKDWILLPSQLVKEMEDNNPEVPIHNHEWSADINVPPCTDSESDCIRYLEHVQIILTVSSTSRGSLSVTLVSPSGTSSKVLPERNQDRSGSAFTNWPFLSVFFFGENPQGKWTVRVHNAKDVGKIDRYQLVLYGTAEDPMDKSRGTDKPIECDKLCDQKYGCMGTGPQDCYQCANGTKIIKDLNKCVMECPHTGFYTDLSDANICRSCDPSCDTCDGPEEDNCQSCRTGLLHDDNNHCVDQCEPGHYQKETECVECPDFCADCTDAQHCRKCDQGPYELTNGVCKEKCAEKQYRDKDGNCQPCEDVNCEVCSAEETCVACASSFKLYKGECVEHCFNDTYLVTQRESPPECKDCSKTCKTCNEGSDNNCLTCKEGYQINSLHQCVNEVVCMSNEYLDYAGNCEPCNEGCATCAGIADDCTSCKGDSYLMDGQCVLECPTGYYGANGSEIGDNHHSCQRCHRTCYTCDGPLLNQCNSCTDDSQLPEDGMCVSECVEGQFKKNKINNAGECANCAQSCRSCTGPRDRDCTECKNGYVLESGACQRDCDPGSFSPVVATGIRGPCKLCHVKCQTCDVSHEHCTSCSPGSFLSSDNRCLKQNPCHPNQYFNRSNSECLGCHQSCKTCDGSQEVNCLTCEPPLSFDKTTHQCLICCSAGQASNGLCCHCAASDGADIVCSEQTTPAPNEQENEPLTPASKQVIYVIVFALIGVAVIGAVIFGFLNSKSLCKRNSVTFSNRKEVNYSQLDEDTKNVAVRF